MHSCPDIEENRCFSNGGTNLHIHTIAHGRPEDNQVEFLQGLHGIVNPPKNLVLNRILRFNMEHIMGSKWTIWHCGGLGLLSSASYIVQRDSLFIHVLLRELYFFIVLCICSGVTVWCLNMYYHYY